MYYEAKPLDSHEGFATRPDEATGSKQEIGSTLGEVFRNLGELANVAEQWDHINIGSQDIEHKTSTDAAPPDKCAKGILLFQDAR